MGKFNNYGSYIGKQNGDAGAFNNVGCVIGEQVVNGGKKENKKHQEELNKRMKELMEAMKKRGGL